jgi:uncharacterized membrane protein
MPDIPDFTNVSWQARRTDEQLLASIVSGKGADMPPASEEIGQEGARQLVAYVRSFAPTLQSHAEREPAPPDSNHSAQVTAPGDFTMKLIRWLGKFHPPATHFPIALLTAAAVAELLGIKLGERAFESVSRYCVWFGAITGCGAGILGWCNAGLRITDASRVMTTHRWLGTCTVAATGLVLVLCEMSRPPDRRRARAWFRVVLFALAGLVSITGFFGGAVVYGLDHYAWPE